MLFLLCLNFSFLCFSSLNNVLSSPSVFSFSLSSLSYRFFSNVISFPVNLKLS